RPGSFAPFDGPNGRTRGTSRPGSPRRIHHRLRSIEEAAPTGLVRKASLPIVRQLFLDRVRLLVPGDLSKESDATADAPKGVCGDRTQRTIRTLKEPIARLVVVGRPGLPEPRGFLH